MANRPSSHSPHTRPSSTANRACSPPTGFSGFKEPEVRRWPHPVDGTPSPACSLASDSQTALLADLLCALSQQICLLTEICSLLEQLVPPSAQETPEK